MSYYGNITSNEKPFNRHSEYGKEIKIISKTAEKLLILFE